MNQRKQEPPTQQNNTEEFQHNQGDPLNHFGKSTMTEFFGKKMKETLTEIGNTYDRLKQDQYYTTVLKKIQNEEFAWKFFIPLSLFTFISSLTNLDPMKMVGAAVLAFMAVDSYHKEKRNERWLKYWQIAGQSEQFSLDTLSNLSGVPLDQVCKDLEALLKKDYMKGGMVDPRNNTFVIRNVEEYVKHYEISEKVPPRQETASSSQISQEEKLLFEIRDVNRKIRNESLSRQVREIEDITQKIFAFQQENPHVSTDIHTFLSYYLPTTLKLLSSYVQLDAQQIEGKHISKGKADIESMMNMVVESFKIKLDQLFQGKTMDISTDILVLEQMFQKDGLWQGDSSSNSPNSQEDIHLKL